MVGTRKPLLAGGQVAGVLLGGEQAVCDLTECAEELVVRQVFRDGKAASGWCIWCAALRLGGLRVVAITARVAAIAARVVAVVARVVSIVARVVAIVARVAAIVARVAATISGATTCVEGRAGDLVVGDFLVDADQEAGVLGAVELSSKGSLGVVGATTGDLHVNALWVVLGAVLLSGGVKANNFVPHDVVSISNRLGDGSFPGVSVGDQLVRRPFFTFDVARLLNLEPLQGGLVGIGAIAIALGHVGDDGAVVALWPFSPVPCNGTTSSNICSNSTGLGLLVTDDVRVRVVVSVHEAQISGTVRPTNGVRWAVSVRVFVNQISTEAVRLTLVSGPVFQLPG